MIGRALLVWLLLTGIAFVNGAFRTFILTPATGEAAGHITSTLLLCGLILLVTWLTIGWVNPPTRRAAWAIGILWCVLTVAFEFLAGHYLFGNTWERLLADYDLGRGRVWVLVLPTTLIAPFLMSRLQGRLAGEA